MLLAFLMVEKYIGKYIEKDYFVTHENHMKFKEEKERKLCDLRPVRAEPRRGCPSSEKFMAPATEG